MRELPHRSGEAGIDKDLSEHGIGDRSTDSLGYSDRNFVLPETGQFALPVLSTCSSWPR